MYKITFEKQLYKSNRNHMISTRKLGSLSWEFETEREALKFAAERANNLRGVSALEAMASLKKDKSWEYQDGSHRYIVTTERMI